MLWGDLEFVIFLSNCTAPIYCNVIKNSYCECLSQFPFHLEGFQVTEHPTNSMCLAVVLHSLLYICWCCLSQSCCPCPAWCPCLWEGRLPRAAGSAEELSLCGRSFPHQCGGRNWSMFASSQSPVLCHQFLNPVLEFWGWCWIPLLLLRPAVSSEMLIRPQP